MPNRRRKYKDMDLYRQTRKNQRNRKYAQSVIEGPKRKWTKGEDELVLAHQMSDSDLSIQISRSVRAIHVRRAKLLKKMKETN